MTTLNDRLTNGVPQSRGFWSFFKRACKIAVADLKGAVEGYKLGFKINPTVTSVINEYIRIIEQDANITDEEKNVIYTAIAIAGYSTDYWNQKIDQELFI